MTTRILYVDDEADIREVAELALGLDPDFEVRSCASGEEALRVAPDWKPDIILLDVMMPFMDGPTTLARLRQDPVTADTVVVFITARTQAEEVQRFKAIGGAGVIPKPFDPMKLAEAVRQYLPA